MLVINDVSVRHSRTKLQTCVCVADTRQAIDLFLMENIIVLLVVTSNQTYAMYKARNTHTRTR